MPKLISIGKLIDESWELYRAKFYEFMAVSGWLLLLAIIYTIALALYPSASTLSLSNELTLSENVGVILYMIAYYIISPLLGIWVLIGLSRMARLHISGRRADSKQINKEILTRFFPTILVFLMVISLLVIAMLIGFGPSILLATIGFFLKNAFFVSVSNWLLIIGEFVALVLFFKWMCEYYFSMYLSILDGARGKKALEGSKTLVHGQFFEVVVRIVIPKLVFILFGIIFMMIIIYVTQIVLSAVGGFNLDLRLRLATMVKSTVPMVMGALISPLIVLADVLLYDSLRGKN